MAELKSGSVGAHAERLAGRTQQMFFSPEENQNFLYPDAFVVDLAKKAEFDAGRWRPATSIARYASS